MSTFSRKGREIRSWEGEKSGRRGKGRCWFQVLFCNVGHILFSKALCSCFFYLVYGSKEAQYLKMKGHIKKFFEKDFLKDFKGELHLNYDFPAMSQLSNIPANKQTKRNLRYPY